MRIFGRVICLLLALLLPITACAMEGAVYEVFVPSFMDSNGDSIGDISGIKEQIPYLQSLSIKGIWLTPIHPSPSYHGYDVTDYKAIRKEYGSIEDFKQLISELDRADIALILDFVVNHSSSEHPWFVSACESLSIEPCGAEKCTKEPLCRQHNPYVDYYNFTYGSGQHSVKGAEGWYYLGVFGPHMPDFNLDNKNVRHELMDIAHFWMDLGVKGFRLDAVIHYYEQNSAKNEEFLRWLVAGIKEHNKNTYIVGEAWSDTATVMRLYSSGIDSLFDFAIHGSTGIIAEFLRSGDGKALSERLEKHYSNLQALDNPVQNAVFLGNHDTGRIAGILRRDLQKLKQAAALYLTIPGVPFIYYGEEIGMTGSGRDENKRLPMLWNANGDGLCLAPSDADQKQKLKQGVFEQDGDEASLLNFYRELLSVREQCPVFANGKLKAIDAQNSSLAAWQVFDGEDRLTVLHNLSAEPIKEPISWGGELIFVFDLGEGVPEIIDNILLMPAFSSCIFY